MTDESEIREVWSSYYEKLLNEEFEWNRDFLNDWQEDESSIVESSESITEEEVKVAIRQIKKGKAAGPSGVTAEMLQAAGQVGIRMYYKNAKTSVKVNEVGGRNFLVEVT